MSSNVIQLFPPKVKEEIIPIMPGAQSIISHLIEWGLANGVDVESAEFEAICRTTTIDMQVLAYEAAA